MRLFVAVDLDEPTREHLRLARRALEEGLRGVRTQPRLTWVDAGVAHVTVRFIGDAADASLGAIREALGAVAIAPFDVTWRTVGAFGGLKHPRVLWVGLTAGQDEFVQLAARVNEQLTPLLGAPEERAFKPHITLARVREPGRGVDWAAALAAVAFGPVTMRVHHLTLYQSRLSPKGPTYTALSTHG